MFAQYRNCYLHGCPCGYHGDPVKECTCTNPIMARYQKKISGPLTSMEMGLLKAGDCNDDNLVGLIDYNILKNSFGRRLGVTGYDDRADFTGNQIVTISDYNILRNNFGRSGAMPIRPSER